MLLRKVVNQAEHVKEILFRNNRSKVLALAILGILVVWLVWKIFFAGGPAKLEIVLYPNGKGEIGVEHYELQCDPPRGNVPNPAQACHVLGALADPFGPPPKGSICSSPSFSSPPFASIDGEVDGDEVHSYLTAGWCESTRWWRVRKVIPGFRD